MEATNETGKNPAGAQSRGAEGGTNLSVGLAAISERAAFENWFQMECSLPDINTIYGTVAWAAWQARARAANVELAGWIAIDLAPKDGTWIRGYSAGNGEMDTRWIGEWEWGVNAGSWEPTHWKPINGDKNEQN